MRTRSFRLLLAKVFRAFRDIKAVFQARFGAHGAGPIPRRIKGLRIFARSTRAHPRVRARDHLKPAVANQTPDDRTVFLFDPGRVVLVVGTGPRHLKSLRPAPIDNRIVHEGSVVVAELKPARRRARPEQRAAPRYGSSPDSPLEGNGFEISVPRCLATANSVGTFISASGLLREPPKQLYRFGEADDRSGDSPAPTVDRPQPDRSLKTAAYLARN